MAIPTTLIASSRSEMHNPVFREIVSKQLSRLGDSTAQLKEVTKALQIRYRGDFYGLLKEHGVSYDYWWYVLRYNGFHSPSDYGGASTYSVPSESAINAILRTWNNTYAS